MASSDDESLLCGSVCSLKVGSSSDDLPSLLGGSDDADARSLGSSSSAKSLSDEHDGVSSCTRRDGVSSHAQHDGVSSCPRSGRLSVSYSTWSYRESQDLKTVWSEATMVPLSEAQRRCIRQNAGLAAGGCYLVGSDCSGSDAVWNSLGALTATWHSKLGCQYQFQKEFCSEHPGKQGDGPRAFLALNSRPRIMFRDMTDRAASGFCSYRGAQVRTPWVHLYSAGWVCRDDSFANTLNRRPVSVSLSDTSGDSTRTLHSSVEYIHEHRPAIGILENPLKRNNIVVAIALLHTIPRYAIACFKANSTSFHSATSRPRIYIVAVNLDLVTIVTPMSQWHMLLNGMSDYMPQASLQDYLLPDDHPHVQDYVNEMRASTVDRSWRRCKRLHQRVRRAFKRRHGSGMPDIRTLREAVLRMPGSQHLSVLSPRQLDVYGLHLWASRIVLGTDMTKHDMVIDVTNNVTLAACKHVARSGSMPCLLRTHVYVHTKRARPICGTERMRLQGFSRDLVLSGLDSEGKILQVTQRDLCSLAGDTMSVPVMGSLLTVVFACCLFEVPSAEVTVEEAELGVPVGGVWVGRETSGKRGVSTEVDTLPMASPHSSDGSSSDVGSLL